MRRLRALLLLVALQAACAREIKQTGYGIDGPPLRRAPAARRALRDAPAEPAAGRARPWVVNGCAGRRIRDLAVEYVDTGGAAAKKAGRSVPRGAKRRVSVPAASGSVLTITGRVDGGEAFAAAFAVDAAGGVALQSGAGGGGDTARIEGATCGPPAPERAGPLSAAALAALGDGEPWAGAARASSSSASALGDNGEGPNLGTYAIVNDAPIYITTGAAPNLRAYDDTARTTRNEPVRIYILQNDRIPDLDDLKIWLFDETDARRPLTRLPPLTDEALARQADAAGEWLEEGDEYEREITDSLSEYFSWTVASVTEETLPDDPTEAQIAQASRRRFRAYQEGSYITYTPSNTLGPRTVRFSYTLQTSTSPPIVGQITVDVLPVESLRANDDYINIWTDGDGATPFNPDEDSITVLDIEVAANDRGPSGDVSGEKDDPLNKSYLRVVDFTRPKIGQIAFDPNEEGEEGPLFSWALSGVPVGDGGGGGGGNGTRRRLLQGGEEVAEPELFCGTDSFTYRVLDEEGWKGGPSRGTVYITVLKDPEIAAEEELLGETDIEQWPYANPDDYTNVPRKKKLVLSGLTRNDRLCGTGRVYSVGSLDKKFGGRIARNGNTVVWYPPKGGLPADVTDASFTYTIGFDYFDARGRRRTAVSPPGEVTLEFAPPDGEEEYEYQYDDYEDV